MKNLKISMFISIVLISLIAIGAVSAAEDLAVTDDLAVQDEVQTIEETAIDDAVLSDADDSTDSEIAVGEDSSDSEVVVAEELSSDLENEIESVETKDTKAPLGANPLSATENFLALYNAINDAGSVLVLADDYTFDGGILADALFKPGVTINKNITINGGGHTINGNGNARIFNIGEGCTVVLNNITFTNAIAISVALAYGNGGAINNQGTLIIENCNFIGNLASTRPLVTQGTGYGGAIYSEGALTVMNSYFADNVAKGDGGAIYASESVDIRNTRFLNNNGPRGGAVYLDSADGIISASSFENNVGNNLVYQIYKGSYDDLALEGCSFSTIKPTAQVNSEYEFGDDITISGDFDWGVNNQTLTMKYAINGNQYSTAVNRGRYSIILGELPVGSYIFSISSFTDINGNEYIVNPIIKTFNVLKAVPVLSVEDVKDGSYDEPVYVPIKLAYQDGTPIADSIVLVVLDYGGIAERTFVLTDDEGEAYARFVPSSLNVVPGTYDIIATFIGDDNLQKVVNDTAKVTVKSTEAIIEAAVNESILFGEFFTLDVNLTDGFNPIANADLIIAIDDFYTGLITVDEEGNYHMEMPIPLDAGEHRIILKFDNANYTCEDKELNLTVEKSGCAMEISVENFEYGTSGNLIIKVDDIDGNPIDGVATVTVDDEIYAVNIGIVDGTASVVLENITEGVKFPVGSYAIRVYFYAKNYVENSVAEHFNVTKSLPVLSVEDVTDAVYGQPVYVPITLTTADGTPVTGATILAVLAYGDVADSTFVETDEQGKAIVAFTPYLLGFYPDTYDVIATFLGDDNLGKVVNDTAKVVVAPSREVNIDVSTAIGEIIIKVTDAIGAPVEGAVNVTFDGQTHEATLVDGVATVPDSVGGEKDVTISYPGSDDFDAKEITETVNVPVQNLIPTAVTVAVGNVSYGEEVTIDFTLNDINGNPLDGILKVTVGEEEKNVTVTGGVGQVKLSNLAADTYPVVANYEGAGIYVASTGTASFNVAKNATKIIYEDMETIAIDYYNDGRVGEFFKWRLVDANGNPIANTPMQIGFNGVVYDEKDGIVTDAEGYAQLQINLARKDLYTFAVCWLGDENHNGSFVVAKINVDTQTPNIAVPNKSYKATASTKTLTATFKSNRGTVIANKKITFTVNGKTYSAKTDDKGVASVNVSLTTKGSYTVTAKFAGDSTYSAVTKTATLKLT